MPAPIPFAGCVGEVIGISRPHTLGQCLSCADWTRGGKGAKRADLDHAEGGVVRCRAWRPMTEPAGVVRTASHGDDSPLERVAGKSLADGGWVPSTSTPGGAG